MPSAYAEKERQRRLNQGEKLSEYFAPQKADLAVRRFELQALLSQFADGIHSDVWYRKAWRWLQRYYVKSAQAPVKKVEEEKK